MTPTLQTGETPSLSHPVIPDISTPAVGGESDLHTLSSTNKIKNAALLSTSVVWVYSPSKSLYGALHTHRFVSTSFRPVCNIPLVVYREQLGLAHVLAPT
ncbi:hypothetical protein AVEN_130302-1 [Araneus ventricosus]|uniref:Uncharacterized protein n=1 Tax=Araneus ventricosus TaxID=182803 RepID=A0A4Y2BFL4_ARAVE|nr:hypothetical protein AVEN_130302-1 [Araneus ventricosus]